MNADEMTYDNATHYLMCRQCVGPKNCHDYMMRCHILKMMPNNRAKILVFGDRYWAGTEHISRVRYVDATRLVENTYGKYKSNVSLTDQLLKDRHT
ncbi:MAG: hypothetical protein J7L96_03225 [Bacteroidales bacterium]|nr:hypothetical protein [Bacteroidales bacterium]